MLFSYLLAIAMLKILLVVLIFLSNIARYLTVTSYTLGQAKLTYSLSSPLAWNSKNLAIISFFIIFHVLFIICHLHNNILCFDLANAV